MFSSNAGKVKMLLFILASFPIYKPVAQDSVMRKQPLSWLAFIDTYYSYDFNRPENHEKPSFIYNHNRHNEVTINLALLKFSYSTENVRGNLGLMAGTYAQYNLASEPEMLRSVYEANVGLKLSRKNNIWIEAGIFPSHIGFESAVSSDSWTLTRSMLAENSPYYEAGVRLSYHSKNEKWFLSGLILNGWQRIRRVDGNNSVAFGSQITFKPTEQVLINWSSFLGNDKPDSSKSVRHFNNLYSIFQLSRAFGITIGLDIGLEQRRRISSGPGVWCGPIILCRFTANEKWTFVARAEYFNDKKGVIVPAVNQSAFQVAGSSIGVDYNISKSAVWRIEARHLKSRNPYFVRGTSFATSNTFFTSSLSIAFNSF